MTAVTLAAGIAGWFERDLLLSGIAALWIVSDPVGPADAVAVFGGGVEARPFAAADYYRRGLARKILVANVPETPAGTLGLTLSDTAANRRILLRLGVPEHAIETFGSDLRSTREEVLALRSWVEQTGAGSLLVPTEIFSTRRVRWMLHSAFPDRVVIRVPALQPDRYGRDDWWRHEAGLVSFQNEVIKYLYYRLRY